MAQKHRSEHRVAGVVWPQPKEMGWISEEIQEQACEKQRTRFRETSGLVSLVGVLLKKCSNFVQKPPPFSQCRGGPPVMNVTAALNSRYTCRAFKPQPLEKDTILAILEAAKRPPSWANTQPWEIFVPGGE